MSISVQLGWLCSTGPTGRQHGPAVRSCSCQCHNPATKRLLFPITLVSGSPWLRICSPLCPAPWMSAQAKTSTARLRPSFAWGRLCSFRPLGPSQYKGLSQELSGRYFLQLWLQSHSICPLPTSRLQTLEECIIVLQNALEMNYLATVYVTWGVLTCFFHGMASLYIVALSTNHEI